MSKSTATINFGSGYQVIKYPAGELQVRFSEEQFKHFRHAEVINVIARVVTGDDIMQLALLIDAARYARREFQLGGGRPAIHLILPYLPYGRADRRFITGDCFGLGVFGSILRSMRVDRVITLDAHNEAVASSALDCDFRNASPIACMQRAILHYAAATRPNNDIVNILFPDAGAAERYSLPAVVHQYQRPIRLNRIYAIKKRDPATGALNFLELPEYVPNHPVLIIDDICDGGGTFLMCAETLRTRGLRQMALYTTHSIYSRGLAPLFEHFTYLYTTDSFFRPNAAASEHTRLIVFDAVAELLPHAL